MEYQLRKLRHLAGLLKNSNFTVKKNTENTNLNMALEAVIRDRDDLYRRLMQAERKLKEMSDLQAMKDSY